MAATNFELKEYQCASLKRFRQYLRNCTSDGASVAFYKATNLAYIDAPMITQGTPYVCLRIPTGGGKTVMAAHSIGIAAKTFLQAGNPMVLWLVPSTPILEQTVSALKNLEHPYRAALAKDFGRNVSILTKAEALSMSRADAEGGACIIVSTIQSFRRENDKGVEDKEGLKVYQDAGALMDHFSGLSQEQEERLDKVEGTNRPIASLANLLRLHRPMVIVDEAHNARTSLSFDTLARFDPSLILELTATPQSEHKPEKDLYPSNILYSVSAAELKAEQMIKMPIKLTTDRDWQKTVGAALDCQAALEEAAKAEQAQTGEYIRPIILFQAQAASKIDPGRITYDKVEEFLKVDKGIPEDQIAVHSGSRKDLDDHIIKDAECRVRYIITVQKLKEGWDCPFAYVLCSVAEQTSATAIEQILGRILRMPKATLKNRPALNEAYAFVASNSFHETAQRLKDGLVDGAGFNKIEVDDLVKIQPDLGYDINAHETEHEATGFAEDELPALEVEETIQKLPAAVRTRLSYKPESGALVFRGPMTKEARNHIHLAFAKAPSAAGKIDRLFAKSNNIQTSAAEEEDKPPFIVPMLALNKQGVLELFSKEHFLDLPWPLDECNASDIVDRFRIVDASQTGQIDITDKGKVEINFAKKLQGELAAVIQEPNWTLPRLANWIDSGIQHPDVTKPSAVVFISNALKALGKAGFELSELARHKYELRKALTQLINDLRTDRQNTSYDALFAAHVDQFLTTVEHPMIFDEQRYAYNQPYAGATKFNKHYTRIIGDLDLKGEEFDCAAYLDQMDEVKYWIRNVDRKQNSFWLQLPKDKFYPDFMALLHDGRVLAVEYKGEQHYTDAEVKRQIGRVWAEASNGQCLFCMPTKRKFELITETVKAQKTFKMAH
ncbi:Type III restriction enzyme, res subunit [Pseudovibrio sp. Ad5]|uniref:DEAD/DEAH box helicase n=1 Tax=Pseudovibrio sp. Ad5 TaxID=989436 RepID=UPI0007AECF59|nr:DEAD/DEAH box helicase family protein [Pseudovibrio sp. Ad5]KZL01613.1 Type III restriction enzyme, res subunit [Pseudovibrio sp. Ad5]